MGLGNDIDIITGTYDDDYNAPRNFWEEGLRDPYPAPEAPNAYSGIGGNDRLRAAQARQAAFEAHQRSLATRGQQSELAQAIRGATAGPSAAGIRSQAAQAQAARQAMASGVSGGLLGARSSMMMQGQGSLAAAVQGANQRVSEQARMQRELGAALQGMRAQDLQQASGAQGQALGLRGLQQEYGMGASDLQKRRMQMQSQLMQNAANRRQRAKLAEMGAWERERQRAAAAQQQNDRIAAAGIDAAGSLAASAATESGD